MKETSEVDEKISPFNSKDVEQVEIFGKIKRVEDPPIRSLLTWSPAEIEIKAPRTRNVNSEWVSEAHDAYKSYMVASPSNLKRGPAFQPKPIVDDEAKPPEKNIKNKSLSPETKQKSFLKSSKVLKQRPQSTQRATKRQQHRIKKLNQTTRWMANSSFKTYFGKPVFANYGQGNVNPAYGGLMYGDYMKTHNIAPHEGANNPHTQQVYEIAEIKALQKTPKPQNLPRKCKDEDRLPPEEVLKLKQRSQILSKPKDKVSKTIVKPDLLNEKIFKSEHNSENEEEGDKNVEKNGQKTNKIIKVQENKDQVIIQGQSPKAKNAPGPQTCIKKADQAKLQEEQKVDGIIKPQWENKQDISKEIDKKENVDEHSQDVSVQVEDCQDCLKQNYSKLVRTSYQDMISKVFVDRKNQIVEPFKYCAKCRDDLYNEEVMRPPYSLAEISFQELNPKNYKILPPQWTQRIPAAGKLSYRSPSAYNVIFGENQPLGGSS